MNTTIITSVTRVNLLRRTFFSPACGGPFPTPATTTRLALDDHLFVHFRSPLICSYFVDFVYALTPTAAATPTEQLRPLPLCCDGKGINLTRFMNLQTDFYPPSQHIPLLISFERFMDFCQLEDPVDESEPPPPPPLPTPTSVGDMQKEECCVCLEHCCHRTSCNHALCPDCFLEMNQKHMMFCPMCKLPNISVPTIPSSSSSLSSSPPPPSSCFRLLIDALTLKN